MKKGYIYLAIVFIAIFTSSLGSYFTNIGLESWYYSLNFPEITPPGGFIGIMWTLIYTLTAISAVLFYRNHKDKKVTIAFLVNVFLNISWSYVFFTAQLIGLAALWAGVLGLSVLALIYLMWNKFRISSYLLFPYLLWVSFATYLNYLIYSLN